MELRIVAATEFRNWCNAPLGCRVRRRDLRELNMKKLALAVVALAAFTGSASAADMAARPMKAPPAVAPVYNWTGFWISGGFGYGLMDIDHSVTSAAAPFVAFDIGQDHGGRGWLGKVGAGADYQFAGPFGSWVVGVFADGTVVGHQGQYGFVCPGGCAGPFNYVGQQKHDWSWVSVAASATSLSRAS